MNELLQQILDRKLIFSQMKGYQRKFIEGLSVIATLNHQYCDNKNEKQAEKLTRLLVRLSLPAPCIGVNFYFHTSLWFLQRFYEAFIKPFEAPQRSVKKNIYIFLSVRPGSRWEALSLSGSPMKKKFNVIRKIADDDSVFNQV